MSDPQFTLSTQGATADGHWNMAGGESTGMPSVLSNADLDEHYQPKKAAPAPVVEPLPLPKLTPREVLRADYERIAKAEAVKADEARAAREAALAAQADE